MPRSTLIHAFALAVGLTGLTLTLAGCDLPPDDAASTSTGAETDAPTTGEGGQSSTATEADGSSSSGDVLADETGASTTSGGGWGGDTGESCEACEGDRFCMTRPQTGEHLCVVACTAALTCLTVTEECVTVAGLSACFPVACEVLADCPAGAVECNDGRCV